MSVTVVASQQAQPSNVLPIGLYLAGVAGVLAIADTQVAPLAVAFLVAAIVFNGNAILQKRGSSNTPSSGGSAPRVQSFTLV